MTDEKVSDALSDYVSRMKRCRQFIMMNVEPQWVPLTGDIDGFCHDEVVRQFHDPRIERDGGVRIKWMRGGWEYALRQSQGDRLPDLDDILALGHYIEPSVNSTIGFRTMNVYIGDAVGCPPKHVARCMVSLLQHVDGLECVPDNVGPHANEYRDIWNGTGEYRYERRADDDMIPNEYAKLAEGIVTVDDWYLAYEAIHPFGDGNGRTGKILHNWLMGTLEEPVLVDDYFGGGNP